MTEIRPDTGAVSKAKMINDALLTSLRRPVGIVISRAIQDEIRATKGWVTAPSLVDPAFLPNQFEIVTNENIWAHKEATLKAATLDSYSASEMAMTRGALALVLAAALGLIVLG